MIAVGIPKEIKQGEKRVGLTPDGVRSLRAAGISVFVEKGAGAQSGFADEDYRDAGAEILPEASSVYQKAGLIQKVKEPLAAEFVYLRPELILFCFLHLASPENCHLVKALLNSRVTAIGYETVQIAGRTPLLKPMSEIAGALAASYASLFREEGFLGVSKIEWTPALQSKLAAVAALYPKIPATSIGKVVIFGGGVAGYKAMEFSLGMGGEVTLVEKNPSRREVIQKKTGTKARLRVVAPEENLQSALEGAEVLIGCVHIPGRRAFRVLNGQSLKVISARQKKILMDVAVDQGGNFPETRPTTYENPVYLDSYGNLRFAVPNIPAYCGPGASRAITEATLRYTKAMALDFDKATREFSELDAAINIKDGEIKIPAIQEAHLPL